MPDTPAPLLTAAAPETRGADAPRSPGAVGFLTLLAEPAGGVIGGYLVTNSWGRPLEFRLTTAVQPTRVQQILYGPTLGEYLHAELIGKALVEKTSVLPGVIVTDSFDALALAGKIDVPVLAVVADGAEPPPEAKLVRHARSRAPLAYLPGGANDEATVDERLGRLDPSLDLLEPFARVREAVQEARKMGVTNRAA